jgi:hypothetical protein
VILDVLGQVFATVEALFELRMSDVAAYDDGTVEREACSHGILAELSENLGHGAVEVDAYYITLACIAQLLGDE